MRIVLPWATPAGHRRHASTRRAGRPPSADRSSPPAGLSGVASGQQLAEEPFGALPILEVAAAAEHQRQIDGSLESVMALLGVSILMGLAGVYWPQLSSRSGPTRRDNVAGTDHDRDLH